MTQRENLSSFIKSESKKLGFTSCGIAKSEFLEEAAPRLEKWLKNGYHGSMQYMENHFDKRLDPSKLVPGSKSVISLMYNYYPDVHQTENTYKISKYAYGEDYHRVIKKKLYELVEQIKNKFGDFHARVFTDSAPVMERNWAQRSGLGWLGKNALLISKQKGSFYFLAEIITDLKIDPDPQFHTDHCGSCTRCIDACPTDAILKNNTVDGSKCISYYTIELKEELPKSARDLMEDWIFGCDICQDVCPWNRFSISHQEERFKPSGELMSMEKRDWEELTNQAFNKLFKNSAVKRTKFRGLSRNIQFLKDNKT